MHILLVHNPDAGDQKPNATSLVAAFERHGHQVEDITLDGDKWQRALDTPAEAIVAAGGDGTARTVAIALATRPHLKLPLAILAGGTANNIARSLGMPEDAGELARCLAGADSARLTIGCARAPWGKSHFVESAGVGVFASMLQHRRIEHPHKDAKIAAGVKRLHELLEAARPIEVRVEADGEDFSGSWLMAQAMNIVAAGSRVEFAPGADPADTALDLVLVGEAERAPMLDYLARLAGGDEEAESPLQPRRFRRITLSWPANSGHVDDHAWPRGDEAAGANGAQVHLEIATAIPVLIPRDT